MNLQGRTIGNYQIREELGRGGMAVVYRAYQQSLNRYVAIKVLPPQLTWDAQFVERFKREARAAANLRHPNIVVIHDVGQEEGAGSPALHYIVMEYLEGQTLKDLIDRQGPLPPQRAARIVEQVGAALDYAHQRGFVHRDIKPANIFVGEGDRVTLTDFGIAKAAAETEQLTRTGALMGTPEYMSPEQAVGEGVDHRTDLYALGVALYQMLVGQVPFHGNTPHIVLHNVIYEPPPPPRRLNPTLSPAVEAVILKAIAKQPEQRFQRGAYLTRALRDAVAGQAGAAVMPEPPPPAATAGRPSPTAPVPTRAVRDVPRPRPAAPARSPLPWILGAIAAVLVLVVAALLLVGGDGESTDETPTAVVAASAAAAASTPAQPTEPILPPPTVTAAVPAPGGNTPTSPPPANTPLPPPPPSDTPAPPPATPVPPTAAPPPSARFGRLAFSSNRDGDPEIYVLDLRDGGDPRRLTDNNANDWLPDWSPDGGRIAFTSNRSGSYDLWVMNADGGGQTAVVATGAWDEYARWAGDDRLSFSSTARTEGRDNSEVFVRYPNGSVEQITFTTAENQWADWSPDGRVVYTEGFQDQQDWNIYLANGDGTGRTAWLGGPEGDVQPTWSPDGRSIAFIRLAHDTNGNGRLDFEDVGDVWVGQAGGGNVRQVTHGVWASTPAWSPDGRWIAFALLRDANGNGRAGPNEPVDIVAVPADGGDLVELVTGPHRDGNPSWTW